MKILVTGAAGLLGSAIATLLYSQRHTVIAVDNLSRGNSVPECSEFLQADLQTVELDSDYDMIYHMSAVNGTDNFYNRPNQTLINNITGDLAAVQIANNQTNLQKFVYASTSELVATVQNVPTPETSTVGFENAHEARWSYSLPKLTTENLLVNSDLPYLIVRYFNVFGPNSKSGHFVHDQIHKINQGVFEVIGANETRSYCYIDDACSATVQLASVANKDIVNIGNDQELTSLEASKIIAKCLGYDNASWKPLPGRSGSTQRRCPDLTKLRYYIGEYYPIDFEQGINLCIQKN
jgi:nucleoside-diphosphate-sugar epimerase